MTRREKTIAMLVGLLAAGFAGDRWILGPALEWHQALSAETADYEAKAADARMLVENSRKINTDWRARHAAGLLDDENGIRFRAQQLLSTSARGSGFTIESLGGGQRVPAPQGQTYDLLRLTLSGQGGLSQTQAFLAALQQAPMPLCVERCEMAARDGRKDQIDVALTLSLRIANAATRAKISVPANTAPWQAGPRADKLETETLKARPFLADRRESEAPPKAAVEKPVENVPPPPPPGTGWTLVGVVMRDGVGEAFVSHDTDGQLKRVRAGDQVADGAVKSVDEKGLCITFGTEDRLIEPGCALTGAQAAPAASGTRVGGSAAATPAVQGTPAAETAAPAAPKPAPVSDAEREAILQRLRQQRNRTSP